MGLSLRTVLEAVARVKMATYMKTCLEQQCTVTPMSYSVNTMAGIKVCAFEKRITFLLAARWKREYSKLVGFVRAKMALVVVRANTLLLRGAPLKRLKWIPFKGSAALEGFHGQRKLQGPPAPSTG